MRVVRNPKVVGSFRSILLLLLLATTPPIELSVPNHPGGPDQVGELIGHSHLSPLTRINLY